MPSRAEIFISHDHADETLALLLKDLIESTFLNISVFVSGRDLTGGDIWVNAIRERLKNADVIISIITQFSVSNAWVLFESEAGFMNSIRIPVCADQITVRKLQPPLNQLHARALTEDGLQKLMKDIAKYLKVRAPKAVRDLTKVIRKSKEFVETRSTEMKSAERAEATSIPAIDRKKKYDEAYAKKVDMVVEDLRNRIIGKLGEVADRFEVPSKLELQKMKLSDLGEVASTFSIPIPRTALAQLLLLQIDRLEADAPKWKIINYEKKLLSVQNEMKLLSQFGI